MTTPNQESLTREDLRYELQHYATKADLRHELQRYATKEDLRHELQRYATKEDVAELKAEFKADIGDLKASLIMWMVGSVTAGIAAAAGIAIAASRLWGS